MIQILCHDEVELLGEVGLYVEGNRNVLSYHQIIVAEGHVPQYPEVLTVDG